MHLVKTVPVLILSLLLAGCATKPPKTYTPVPALTSTRQSVTDAKDYLSRAKNTNAEIDKELDALEQELDTP